MLMLSEMYHYVLLYHERYCEQYLEMMLLVFNDYAVYFPCLDPLASRGSVGARYASRRSRVGVGMNRSVREGKKCKAL